MALRSLRPALPSVRSVPTAGLAGEAHRPRGGLAALTIGALGVVYGDIGTSPLYAVNGIFLGSGQVGRDAENIEGAISLIVWALTLVVGVKYLIFVLRADSDGEGGVFALYSLLHRMRQRFRSIAHFLPLLILSAGLLFGAGLITPAISVISAVEGLRVAAPRLEPFIVTITIVILTGLFSIQSKGTAKVGRVFGPLVIVWFVAIGVLGLRQIVHAPAVLHAFDPRHGINLLRRIGFTRSLPVLGAVMLSITGGEALYADMGHFGKRPIRTGWYVLVYPALLANYLGQGAFLLSAQRIEGGSIFYSMVPAPIVFPMILLATGATIIASQALISGAFSLASQAVGLGLFPRIKIVHTHQHHEGQIYVPFVNWALYVGCVMLVLSFRSSTRLAAAYGLAVSADMLTTSIAMLMIALMYWKWPRLGAVAVFGSLAVIDGSFLVSNSLKFLEGGFVPLTIGIVIAAVMITWRWGRKLTFAGYSAQRTMTMRQLIELKHQGAASIDRNMVFMVPKPLRSLDDNTPALLQLFWERYGVLPKHLFFVEVVHRKVPYVHDERCHVTVFDRDRSNGSVISVTVAFGFMEANDVEKVLEGLASHHEIDLPLDPREWVVHVSQERLMLTGPVTWHRRLRLGLFSVLRRMSQPAYYYYGLGNGLRLGMEIMTVKSA